MTCRRCHTVAQTGFRVKGETYCCDECFAEQINREVDLQISMLKSEVEDLLARRIDAIARQVALALLPREIKQFCAFEGCSNESENLYCSNACKQKAYRARKNGL